MDYYTYLRNIEYMNQMNNAYAPERTNALPWPLTLENKSQQFLLSKAIEQIKEYIEDENNDAEFYTKLISLAPTDEQKKIIEQIRDDELVHIQIFRKIFTELTGVVLGAPSSTSKNTSDSFSYKEGIKKAFFGELDAIKKYRETMAYMPNKVLSSMLLYVLTDEIIHADKYNYILGLDK